MESLKIGPDFKEIFKWIVWLRQFLSFGPKLRPEKYFESEAFLWTPSGNDMLSDNFLPNSAEKRNNKVYYKWKFEQYINSEN